MTIEEEKELPTIQIAIINASTVLADADIASVVPMFQTKVSKDIGPALGVEASLAFVPAGSQPQTGASWLVIANNSDQADVLGYRDTTSEGLPLGRVFAASDLMRGRSWAESASEELRRLMARNRTKLMGLGHMVPTLGDQPAQNDELGRQAFARALAIRIRRVWKREIQPAGRGNFLIHVHGPWGAGKSTVLNLLRKELHDGPKPWVTVDFNAWQYQRIAPPWWWLMKAVYSEALRQRPFRFRRQEFWWRLRVTFSPYLWIFIAAVVALSFFWLTGVIDRIISTPVETLGKGARAITDVLALLAAVSSIILGLSRTLALGSARSATSFLETARDPMAALATHYNDLVRQMGPVAIFIDDLDRCRADYVMELLEGIQTLYREAPAVYVVVAERRWLQSSYENGYATFTGSVAEPGRPLGNLFLEKTFQLSTSIPPISDAVQKAYWQRLLLGPDADQQEALETARQWAKSELNELSRDAIQRRLRAGVGKYGLAGEQALREEAIVRFAEDDISEDTERMLRAFVTLLEPNPRAMKRLVNAFGVQRDFATYAGIDIPERELVLWTIVCLRWPLLTQELEKNPSLASNILERAAPAEISLTPELHALVTADNVCRVFKGGDIGVSLTPEMVERCATLRTSDSSATGVA